MSSALPWGTPSTTSTRTTSPNSLYARLTAQLAPTFPPPTTVIFLRIEFKLGVFDLLLRGFLAGFFTGLLEQETEGLVGTNVAGDAAQPAILLELGARDRGGLALL